jgi:hypothetical protein
MYVILAKGFKGGQFRVVAVVGFRLRSRGCQNGISLLGRNFPQFGGCPPFPNFARGCLAHRVLSTGFP